MDIKENLSQNLIKYRKASGLTQIELAEKLNYSDKAVSKWERGESIPDLSVLKNIADLYGVTIDTLISPPSSKKPKTLLNLPLKRLIISFILVFTVWLVAIVCYVFLELIIPSLSHYWLAFIYAIPISLLILLILTSVWGKNLTNNIITSLFVWSILLSVFLTFITIDPVYYSSIWMIMLIGIPLQVLIILWFTYKKVK